MNKPKIVFWTPINAKSGLGHFYRMLGLYEELLERNNNVAYFTNEEFIQVESNIIIYSYISINIEAIISYLKSIHCKVLILDNYTISKNIILRLNKEFKVILFDSNFKNPVVDVIINFNPFSWNKYKRRHETVKYFLGLEHNILRRQITRALVTKIDDYSIFICIGGSDVSKTTYKLIDLIPTDKFLYKIVLGKGCSKEYVEEVKEKLKIKNFNYILYYHPEDFFSILNSCKYAIVSCSTIVYELLYFNKPFFCINVIPNQDNLEKYLRSMNITVLKKDKLNKVSQLIKELRFKKLEESQNEKNMELIKSIEELNEKI